MRRRTLALLVAGIAAFTALTGFGLASVTALSLLACLGIGLVFSVAVAIGLRRNLFRGDTYDYTNL